MPRFVESAAMDPRGPNDTPTEADSTIAIRRITPIPQPRPPLFTNGGFQRDTGGTSVNLYSQLRALTVMSCPTHEHCDGRCPGGPGKPHPSARPLVSRSCDFTTGLVERPPINTNGRTEPLTLGNTFELYGYSRLQPGTVRLLKVHRAVFRADAVVCEVVVCALEAAPKYAAMSYCWGTGLDECKILLVPDGKVFLARKSLAAALKRFRAADDSPLYHGKEEYIWADAICINQDDSAEKMEQLLMMQDIYKKAEAVYVDLGDEQPEWYSAYSLMTVAAYVAGSKRGEVPPGAKVPM